MFRSKTVFIIGAGASREAGLPMGQELKERIAEKLNIKGEMGRQTSGDHYVYNSYLRFAKSDQSETKEPGKYWAACNSISRNMPLSISIDNYLDAHRGDKVIQFCGKLGIAACILEAERSSLLHYDLTKSDRMINWKDLRDTWYIKLQQILTENVSKDEIDTIFENVSFIVFNYDRCLEHFLAHSLAQYYEIGLEGGYELVNSAKIFHPYGVVGDLPWQNPAEGVSFGAELQRVDLAKVSRKLKTFTERVEEGEQLAAMRLAVQEASKIVFLGFSYGESNLDLIAPASPANPTMILGTAHGISSADIKVIIEKIAEILHQDRGINHERTSIDRGATCSDFFQWYQRSIPA